MPRFLSPEWFVQAVTQRPSGDSDLLAIDQVVTDTPYGEVRYRVVVGDGWAGVLLPGPEADQPDLTLTTSWPTACALAQGRLSTQRGLLEGLVQVAGNITRLDVDSSRLGGLDPLPPGIRDITTY
jgi:hypothetical protein